MKGLRERPKGSGHWEVSFYDRTKNPKRRWKRFDADSYEDAVIEAARFRKLYDMGEWSPWGDNVGRSIRDAAEAYMKAHKHQRRNTLMGKRSMLNTFLEDISSQKFFHIDETLIGQYLSRWRNQATRRTRLQDLSHFWSWCVEHGYTERNPVARYIRRNPGCMKKPTTGRDAMMPNEFIQLYGEAIKSGDYFPAFVELGVCTGLRRGELLDLNVRDVMLRDDRSGSINIREWTNPATGRHFVPKTEEATRLVPLAPRAAMLLRLLLDEVKTDDPWQHIFVAPPEKTIRDDDHVRYNDPSDRFRICRNACGYGRSITLHSTRHSYLSWLIMLGVNPYAVKSIAGHSSLKTQERYIHFAHQMLSGGASQVRREIMAYLCPGVSEDVLLYAFPDSTTWYGAMNESSALSVMDMLYGGLLYDEALVQRIKQDAMRRSLASN